jgi:hypothetical protein
VRNEFSAVNNDELRLSPRLLANNVPSSALRCGISSARAGEQLMLLRMISRKLPGRARP